MVCATLRAWRRLEHESTCTKAMPYGDQNDGGRRWNKLGNCRPDQVLSTAVFLLRLNISHLESSIRRGGCAFFSDAEHCWAQSSAICFADTARAIFCRLQVSMHWVSSDSSSPGTGGVLRTLLCVVLGAVFPAHPSQIQTSKPFKLPLLPRHSCVRLRAKRNWVPS